MGCEALKKNGKYTCNFLLYSGEVCGHICRKPDRCCFHKNAKINIPCSKCDKGTSSKSGRCPDHTRGYYVVIHYQKHFKKKCNSTLEVL